MDILISGNISGLGIPSYYANISRQQTFNPQLIIDEQPYLPGDCPIAAIEYDGFSPNKIINIISNENEIYENSVDFHKVETLTYDSGLGVYPITHYPYSPLGNDKIRYIVTNYNSDPQNNNPLFYQYELLYDAFSDASGVVVKNIYKNNETKINPKEFKVQYSTDTLGNGNVRYSGTTWTSNKSSANTHRVRVLLPFYFSSRESFYTIEYDKYLYDVKTYQKELIEVVNLYTPVDYSITDSGLVLTPTGSIVQTSALSILKDPYYRITPLDIVTLKDQNTYMSDKMAQWKLRLNIGSFYIPSGYYTGISGSLYNLANSYTSGNVPVTNIKPTNIYGNILQVKETPIYVDTTNYSYPSYKIETYDNTTTDLNDTPGKMSITVNGVNRTDIRVKSIDRIKGFIELNKSLNILDEVELSFHLDDSNFIILENFELNPKISISGGCRYHINSYPNGFGIAMKNSNGEINYPYIYDLSTDSANRLVSGIVDIGSTTVISGLWDNTYITICYGTLNNLSVNMVKKTDCRRIGGGLVDNKTLGTWFNNFSGIYVNEKKWYTDMGYYDGLPLSHSSTVVIHIPMDYITALKQRWIDYFNTFNDADSSEIISEREFKHYMDQTIRRYISAGSDYIILPTISGQITGTIMDLRK